MPHDKIFSTAGETEPIGLNRTYGGVSWGYMEWNWHMGSR